MLIDITRTIGLDTLVYPGDNGPVLERAYSMAVGDCCNASRLEFSAHCGTHLDAPSHFTRDGQTIDELPLERFRLAAHVVDTGAAESITPGHIGDLQIDRGSAVLFKTSNGNLPRDKFVAKFVCLTAPAAQALIDSGVSMVGIDYLSIEGEDDPAAPIHQLLLGAGVLILEDIDLRDVTPGRYTLTCYPLRLYQTEASPCRAVLETL